MPWCLFRWVFCIEFDLKNGNVVRKKVFRKVLICPLWCQGRKLLGNGGNGAGAEEDDQTPPFDRFVPVIPGNPEQQDASRVSERFGGMRPDEASELLSSQPGQFAGLDEVPACPRRKQHSPPSCAGDGVTSVCLLSWSPAGSDTSQHCFSAAVIPQKYIAELGLPKSS